MKMKSIFVAVALVAASTQSYAADWNFTVDSSATWVGYFSGSLWEGSYGVADLRATFPATDTIFLQSNVLAQDVDPAWNGVTLTLNSYQEATATIGDTVEFDFYTVADTLTSQGYVAEAFIKVLDGGVSWATTQEVSVPLTAGQGGLLNLTVADAGAGFEAVQAGFRIIGLSDTTGSGTDTLGVTVVPEPATLGLLGISGIGLLLARRRFTA